MKSLNEPRSKEPPVFFLPTPCRDLVVSRPFYSVFAERTVCHYEMCGEVYLAAPRLWRLSLLALCLWASLTACFSPVALQRSRLLTTKHLHVLAFKAIRP